MSPRVVRSAGGQPSYRKTQRLSTNVVRTLVPIGGTTDPRFTLGYRIGDRICSIQGRDLSLRTNAGAPTEEGEIYPAVVGLTWDFDGNQQTILQLSDQRGQIR